jgi:hypothetical protein
MRLNKKIRLGVLSLPVAHGNAIELSADTGQRILSVREGIIRDQQN